MNPKDSKGRLKSGVSSVPCEALLECNNALLSGALKYGRHNWREIGKEVYASTYYDAAMRHLMAWWEGQDRDPDSQVHHLAHVMANMLILRDAEMRGVLRDDRPPQTAVRPDRSVLDREAANLVNASGRGCGQSTPAPPLST